VCKSAKKAKKAVSKKSTKSKSRSAKATRATPKSARGVVRNAKSKRLATRAKGAAARPAKKKRAVSKAGHGPAAKPVVIDFHAHIVVPEVLDFSYEHSIFAKTVAAGGQGGRPQAIPEPLMQRMTDMPTRLKEMDVMGVDIQVISPSILQQCTYWAEPEAALKMERIGNEAVAEAVTQHPDRLVGLGSVPLQDTTLAVRELERSVRDLGLKGVIISSHVNGIELGEARFDPFWAKAQELDTTIFIHPAGSPDKRMTKHRLLISLGQPLEEAFAQSSLVYEGVMDRFPKLKIAMAHGGGFLPFYTGRHDFTYRGGHMPYIRGDFSSYLPRFYYDAVLFNPDMLEYLATRVPVNRIMLASDFPFAEKRPVEFVRRAKKIAKKDQDAMLGANCARMLGLSI
jgi:aminocarboxymuconate-semialdehyde decarboxylase